MGFIKEINKSNLIIFIMSLFNIEFLIFGSFMHAENGGICKFHLTAIFLNIILSFIIYYIKIKEDYPINFFFLIIILFFGLGLIYSNFQIIWNDERQNLVAVSYINKNGIVNFFKNYGKFNEWLGAKHPPLIPIIESFIFKITKSESFYLLRIFNLILSIGILIYTYLFGKKFYNLKVGLISIIFIFSFPIYFWISNSAILDIPFVFLLIVSLYYFWEYANNQKLIIGICVGILVSLGMITKYSMIIFYPTVFISVYLIFGGSFLKKYFFPLIGVPLLLTLPWLIYTIISGLFTTSYIQVASYFTLSLKRPGGLDYITGELLPLFPIHFGIYNIPISILTIYYLLKIRKKEEKFLIIWILSTVGFSILTVPAPRYLLPALPPLSILMAKTFVEFSLDKKILILSLIFSGITIILYHIESFLKLTYIFY